MNGAAPSVVTLVALLAVGCAGCASSEPDRCPSGWGRFVASLNQTPEPYCDKSDPGLSGNPAAIAGSVSLCPAVGSDLCSACIAGSCCSEAVACAAETTCECLLRCRAGGDTLASCSSPSRCNVEPDPAYAALTSCVTASCASSCPGVP